MSVKRVDQRRKSYVHRILICDGCGKRGPSASSWWGSWFMCGSSKRYKGALAEWCGESCYNTHGKEGRFWEAKDER